MAGTLRTDELQLRILIDGTPARRELAELDQKAVQLTQALRGMKKGTEEYVAASKELEQVRQRQEALRNEIGLTALTYKQLQQEAARLRIAMNNMTPNTAEWAATAQRLDAVNARMNELRSTSARTQAVWDTMRQGMTLTRMTMQQLELEAGRLRTALHTMDPNDGLFVRTRRELIAVEERMATLRTGLGPMGRLWADVKMQVAGAGAVLGGLLAGGAIINGLRGWVTGSAELSDAQADVQRTTGLTRKEVLDLTRDLGNLNTRTARSELLALAADAGKLGITGRENILQFVRAGDQIRVALGEDLGEDAIKQIGKLNQTFDVGKATGKNLEEQMLATGSAINALGQASTADEAFLVDFTTRMAGVNTQANINVQSTLGYAAALDQLGQRSETSSTALSQFTLKAFTKTAEYAKIAGMELKDFQRLLQQDTNEALLRVLEGLKGNNEGLSRMTGLFADMGQEGARAVSVLSSLANNTQLVRQQQAIANGEFAKGTSITNEFNTKNNTLAANLDIIGKRLYGAFVNSTVVLGIQRIAQGLRDMVSPTVADGIEEERQALYRLYSQILTTNEGTTERLKLVRELQDRYPQILGNLNAETATNQQLAVAIRQVNEQLINRIIIARQQERIDAEVQRTAEARQERLDQEDNVLQKLEATARKYNVELQAGKDVLEQSQRTYVLIKEAQDKVLQGRSAGGVLVNDVARLGNAIEQLRVAQAQENERSEVGNFLLQEKNQLMQRLGVTAEETAGKVAAAVSGATPGATEDAPTTDAGSRQADAERERMRRALDETRQLLERKREELYQATLTADEREIRQLDVKHAEERQRISRAVEEGVRAKLLSEEQGAQLLRDLDERYLNERVNLIEEQGNRRAQKATEAAEKVRLAEQQAMDQAYLDQLGEEDQAITRELQKMDEWVAIYERAGMDVSSVVERTERAVAAIRKKYRDQEKAAAVRARQEAIQQQIVIYQGVSAAIGGMNALMAAGYEASGRANYQATVGARMLGIAQIIIAQGVAVAEAIKAGAGLPFPANLGAIGTGTGAVLTAMASAIAMLSRANVSAPSFTGTGQGGNLGGGNQEGIVQLLPTGAQGIAISSASGGGVMPGQLHSDGGNMVVDTRTGQPIAEVERDELMLVLSRQATAANADLIPLLLEASRKGERLPVFNRPVPAFDFAGVRENLQWSRMATGGVITRGTALVNGVDLEGGPGGGAGNGELVQLMRAMVAGQQQMREELAGELRENTSATRRSGRFDQNYDRAQQRWEALKDRNTAKRRR